MLFVQEDIAPRICKLLAGYMDELVIGDPLQLTTLSMALNAVIAPFIVFPLLIVMNDRAYLRDHRNHAIGNVLVSGVVVLAFIVALVAIPLEVFGG